MRVRDYFKYYWDMMLVITIASAYILPMSWAVFVKFLDTLIIR